MVVKRNSAEGKDQILARLQSVVPHGVQSLRWLDCVAARRQPDEGLRKALDSVVDAERARERIRDVKAKVRPPACLRKSGHNIEPPHAQMSRHKFF